MNKQILFFILCGLSTPLWAKPTFTLSSVTQAQYQRMEKLKTPQSPLIEITDAAAVKPLLKKQLLLKTVQDGLDEEHQQLVEKITDNHDKVMYVRPIADNDYHEFFGSYYPTIHVLVTDNEFTTHVFDLAHHLTDSEVGLPYTYVESPSKRWRAALNDSPASECDKFHVYQKTKPNQAYKIVKNLSHLAVCEASWYFWTDNQHLYIKGGYEQKFKYYVLTIS